MKRTKIVCTVGPGTDKFGILEDMMRAGMNVAPFFASKIILVQPMLWHSLRSLVKVNNSLLLI